MTVVLTKLHAGGKFGGDGYKVSGGLHGVGVSVVNALSEWLIAEVAPGDGKLYRQEFARGVPQTDAGDRHCRQTGTTISFLPDAEIFDETVFHSTTLLSRFREMAFLTRGLRFTFVDERADGGAPVEFHYEGGIKDFVQYINESKDVVHRHIVYFETANDQGEVEVAMQWNAPTRSPSSRSPTTSTPTRAARTSPVSRPRSPDAEQVRARQGPAEGEGRQPRGRGRARRARRRHLGQAPATRSSKARRRRSSATRGSAGSSRQAVNQKLAEFFEENPTDAHQIINKAIAARARGRRRARRAS